MSGKRRKKLQAFYNANKKFFIQQGVTFEAMKNNYKKGSRAEIDHFNTVLQGY